MAGLSPNLLDGIDPKLFPFDPDQQIASLTQSNSSLAIMNPDVADSNAASHRDLTIAESSSQFKHGHGGVRGVR
jgi:hypothetical protein